MLKYHLFLSPSPHLYLTTRHKLKYVSGKMKPSAADKKSGKRIYLNRCLLMDDNSGCLYLEYLPDSYPCSLYPYLYRAFADKGPEKNILSGMPDTLIVPRPRQNAQLVNFLQGQGIGVEAPEPGFRKGSSVLGELTRHENNYEDDGLWMAPSTEWPVELADLNRYMMSLLKYFHNDLPVGRNPMSRAEVFYQAGQELRFPGEKKDYLAMPDQQTRQEVDDFENTFSASIRGHSQKIFTEKDWFKADEVFDEGMEYSWSGHPKKALQAYRRALEIHPGHVDAHVHIGNFLTRIGRYAQARESYTAAVKQGRQQLGEIEPGNAWLDIDTRPFMRALHGLGLVLEKLKERNKALECYLELLKIDPDDHIGIRYLMGRIYHELGDFKQAEERYKIASEWPDGAWGLVWLYLEQKDPGKASLAAVKALESNAHVPAVFLEYRYLMGDRAPHCAMYSHEQAVAYYQDYSLFLFHRKIKWREFLKVFLSVAGINEKIREMKEARLPPGIPERQAEELAAGVLEKLGQQEDLF
ncbi:MAG: tetratricopeptide repeat protein [Desulfonatronovibrio sp.]